jgi:hypothetical protein
MSRSHLTLVLALSALCFWDSFHLAALLLSSNFLVMQSKLNTQAFASNRIYLRWRALLASLHRF